MEEQLEQQTEGIEPAVDLVADKLQTWWDALLSHLPNIAVALLLLAAFWLVAHLTRKLVARALRRLSVTPSIAKLMATLVAVAVIILGLFVALSVLKLDKAVTSLLAGAGVLGLVLGFAFQDIAADLLAGFLLAVRKPFVHGDLIESNDSFGTVREINLRTTVLESPQGQLVLIPNREVFTNTVINFSTLGRRRIDLPVGVSYGDDLERVAEVAKEAVAGVSLRDPERDVELFFQEFGGSSINFIVRFWIPFRAQSEFHRARSEAIVLLQKAFERADITIPFPIRTLDFGIKGGLPLSDVLGREAPANGGEAGHGIRQER